MLDAGSNSYPFGALWDIRLQKGSDLLRLHHYYDQARNTTRVIEDGGDDLTFVVDDLGRLIARKITGGADQEVFGYASSGGNDGRIGNITSKTNSGGSQTYAYSISKPHAVTNDGAQPCEYDTNGNMTRRGSLYLKYNPAEQMVKASSDSGGLTYIARMAYDGDGKRAKRVDNYGTIHYIGPHYERNVGTGQNPTETITKFYVAQLGKMKRLVALRRKINGSYEDLRYIVPDHLGGTIRVVDTACATVDNIRYHSFGATRSGGASMPLDKLYTGQVRDASIGLYFYNARYYDPSLGRFLAADQAGPDLKNPQSLNRYSYGLNNPVRYTDPTGNRTWDGELEGGGGGDEDSGGVEGAGGDEIGDLQMWGYTDPDFPSNLESYHAPSEAPPGVDVYVNMNEASASGFDTVNGVTIFDAAVLGWRAVDFANRVRPDGQWDIKRSAGSAYEDYGNFHFGAVGRAWGWSEEALLRGAGVAQFGDDTLKNINRANHNAAAAMGNSYQSTYPVDYREYVSAKEGIPGITPPFADERKDQAMATRGSAFYAAWQKIKAR